nr:MAG TPA: hypothetical protein [Caudoviricetes sp.]
MIHFNTNFLFMFCISLTLYIYYNLIFLYCQL